MGDDSAQLMSVMWSRPSMPFNSMNAPKSVMFLTVPLRMSPGTHFGQQLGAFFVALLFDQFARESTMFCRS